MTAKNIDCNTFQKTLDFKESISNFTFLKEKKISAKSAKIIALFFRFWVIVKEQISYSGNAHILQQ